MNNEQNGSSGLTEPTGIDSAISTDEAPGISSGNPPAQEFCIDDAERANWLVRRIVEARAYGDRVRIWAEKEQRRAERDEAQLMHLFGRQLQEWVSVEVAALKGRRKSINLPGGTVGFRRVGPRLLIEDRAAVMAWARENYPEAIITRHYLSKTAINELYVGTGEVPGDGVRIQEGRETFFIR